MRPVVTVNTDRARRILNTVGKSFTKANRRTVARGAAKILQDDMRAGSGGVVPQYGGEKKKGARAKYHYFESGGFYLKIKAGNLRKSHKMFTFRRSGLMWVGAKYGYAKGGGHDGDPQIIGETYRTSDGFYDKMYIANTGKKYHERALARKSNDITRRLTSDANSWLSKVVKKANATP